MQTLFPIEPVLPEGFSYIPDFINNEEEDRLYAEISKLDLHLFNFQGYEAKRKVASFGYDWSFEKKVLNKGKDIPGSFHFIINKVSKHLSKEPEDFAELLVTEYPVGSVINWHRDAPPFDLIAGISLRTDCIFKLRPHEKKKAKPSVYSVPARKAPFSIYNARTFKNRMAT
jgi:alkylated DNA repair dioxygenase AlkB